MADPARVSGTSPYPPPGFRRFWAGEAVSSLGTYVTLLALQTMVVLDLGGSAQDVGWLSSARWLPYLVLGLVAGALVDRCRRRPIMIVTDLLRAALLAAIPLAWVTGALSLGLLLVIVALYGTASLVNDAASMSFVPRLVPREHLQRAHARIDGADAVAQTTGPALAGVLVKLVGAPLAVLVDAASYLFSAFVVATLPVRESPAVRAPLPNLRREIGEGVVWIYRRSGMGVLAVSAHIWFAGAAVMGAVVAPFALVTLELSPVQFGIVAAFGGLGSVLGAATSSLGGRRLGTRGAIVTAHLVSCAGVALMALAGLGTAGWAAAGVLGLGQASHGFGLGFSNSHEMSYQQNLTPDALQARTNITKRSVNRAVIVVVAPLGGLLADLAGARAALLVAAAVFGLSAAILLLSPFRTTTA